MPSSLASRRPEAHAGPRRRAGVCVWGGERRAGSAPQRAHWLLPVTSRSAIKGARLRAALEEREAEGCEERGRPGCRAAAPQRCFTQGS